MSTVTDAVPAHPPAPPVAPGRGARAHGGAGSRWATWVAVGGAVLPLTLLLAALLVHHGAVTPSGDRAVTTLEVRDLLAGHQLVGAYSRFGWHHPGPAFFVPLAVADVLSGGSHWAFDAGMLAAGIVTSALIVATVRTATRRVTNGPLVALASAGLLGLLVRLVGPATLRDPWNPWGALLPLALLLVLCGLAATGSRTAFACAVLAASIAVQTHVGVAPLCVAALACGGLMMRRARRDDAAVGRLGLGWPGLAAALASVAVWTPPIVQELTGADGNLTDLWRFFVAGHPGHGLATAVATVGSRLGLFPFGSTSHLLSASPEVPWSRSGGAAAVVLAYVAAGTVLAAVGRYRRDPFVAAMGTLTAVGVLVAVLAVTTAEGPLDGYVVAWVTVIAFAFWIGVAAAVGTAPGDPGVGIRQARIITGALSIVAVLGTGTAVWAVSRAPSPANEDSAIVRRQWDAMAPELAGRPRGAVLVEVDRPEDWPVEAGLVLQLEEHGWHAHVTDDWLFMFGPRRRQTGREALVATVLPDRVDVRVPLSGPALARVPTQVASILGTSAGAG